MANILETFTVNSLQLGKAFKIDLAEGLDTVHLDFMEAQWAPAMKRQYDLTLLDFFQLPVSEQTLEKEIETLAKFDVQDHHWVWRKKCAIAPGHKGRIFSLLNASEVEAAMMLLVGKSSRHPSTSLPLVYVDFVAIAPWNRKAFQSPRRFRNLGTIMIGAAVELSRTLGWDGRCGLHSLPQSVGFYRHIGMRDFGLDPAKPLLRYFEFDAPAAQKFRK